MGELEHFPLVDTQLLWPEWAAEKKEQKRPLILYTWDCVYHPHWCLTAPYSLALSQSKAKSFYCWLLSDSAVKPKETNHLETWQIICNQDHKEMICIFFSFPNMLPLYWQVLLGRKIPAAVNIKITFSREQWRENDFDNPLAWCICSWQVLQRWLCRMNYCVSIMQKKLMKMYNIYKKV